MSSSSFFVQHLFDGLHRLDEAQVRRALTQGADLTARNSQGHGVFQALFQCADLEVMGMDAVTGHLTQNRLEDWLVAAGATVPLSDSGAVLSLRLELLFEAVRDGVTTEAEAMPRLNDWLQRAPFQGHADHWGKACWQAWWAEMGEAIEMECEEGMDFGLPSFTALVYAGMSTHWLTDLDADFHDVDKLHHVAEATARLRETQTLDPPTAHRRRRPT